MNTPKKRAYLILGAVGSGRRAVLADLVGNGLGDDERALVLIATGESPAADAVQAQLAGLTRAAIGVWSLDRSGGIVAEVPDEVTDVFLLVDGRANPVDQVEAFQGWLGRADLELARIITVVDCGLAHAQSGLERWYDACVHFSDVVLLNHRDGVPNKWISDFTGRYQKQHFPCLIDMVKKEEVANPALILEPQARRMSMAFDPAEEWPLPEGADDEGEDGELDADDLIGGVDPYFERLASGRRGKEIPDVAKFLGER